MNENCQTSDNYAKSSRELYIPSLGINGYVNNDAPESGGVTEGSGP